MRYLPPAIFLMALAVGYGSSRSHDPGDRRLGAGVFALLMGISALLWGVNELRAGRALVLSNSATRDRQPFVFWTVILVFRFAIGAVLVAAGLWGLAVGSAS